MTYCVDRMISKWFASYNVDELSHFVVRGSLSSRGKWLHELPFSS
jgi:hypothetical protein